MIFTHNHLTDRYVLILARVSYSARTAYINGDLPVEPCPHTFSPPSLSPTGFSSADAGVDVKHMRCTVIDTFRTGAEIILLRKKKVWPGGNVREESTIKLYATVMLKRDSRRQSDRV